MKNKLEAHLSLYCTNKIAKNFHDPSITHKDDDFTNKCIKIIMFKYWNLVFVGLFCLSLSQKLAEMAEICQQITGNSHHNQF